MPYGALGVSFHTILTVGHSLGSYIAIEHAASYPGDVQAVVLTGFVHNINPAFLILAERYFYPATYDPLFLGRFPRLDYMTSRPNSREILFYYAPEVASNVVTQDEIAKHTTFYMRHYTRYP